MVGLGVCVWGGGGLNIRSWYPTWILTEVRSLTLLGFCWQGLRALNLGCEDIWGSLHI